MLFSSMIFLWLFLPITMISYFIISAKYKNIFLLIASLFFYSWGEPRYIIIMILSIALNYTYGIFIDNECSNKKRRFLLIQCISLNLFILGYFKYYNFFIDSMNNLFKSNIPIKDIVLPIGISFYTFQALSYVVDVYRGKNGNGDTKVQRNIFNLALYISLFPQLIAGPIIKYKDIDEQIEHRTIVQNDIVYGIKRFIYGLSKKVLISNSMASVADKVFSINSDCIGTQIAWIGIIAYTLQIYFDFSGYSDMAIGLGRIFGFKFSENFNYPYISQSIKEFWTRWHISLSTWFKEYLYIPLGGNRKGNIKTYRNLLLVFLATGIWHGASWTFVVWGLYNGLFIVIERIFLGNILSKNKFKFLNHVYTILVFMIGWVFFRSDSISYAIEYINKLLIYSPNTSNINLGDLLDSEIIFIMLIGILLSGIIQTILPKFKDILYSEESIGILECFFLFSLLFLVTLNLASGSYNPFIYFRF